MSSNVVLHSLIYLLGVVISSFSQILLKKSANKETSLLKQYLNIRVIVAYGLFFGATLLSIFAYRVIPLTLGAILGTFEYGLVAILGYLLLKEKIHIRQIVGILVIVAGIIVYSL